MKVPSTFRSLALASLALTFIPLPNATAETTMRTVGNYSSTRKQIEVESAFFESLSKNSGVPLKTTYAPMDQLGIQASDGLRLLKSGAFDVMSIQMGQVSRDDPFLEGIDLVGVSTDLQQLRAVVDAYRDVLDKRLQEKFQVKVLTLWPYGPQVFFCNKEIKSLADFKGLKVRSFTPSMSELIQDLGATPVTMGFPDVYPSLQRGVINCGVTSPTSGNTGKWPEVTTHFLPLAVTNSMQGNFVNLKHWKKYTPEQQQKLEAEFKKLEDSMWGLASTANADAANCNVGDASCKDHAKFDMKLVQVSPEDQATLKSAVSRIVLPLWQQNCDRVTASCSSSWNETVGKVSGFKIQ